MYTYNTHITILLKKKNYKFLFKKLASITNKLYLKLKNLFFKINVTYQRYRWLLSYIILINYRTIRTVKLINEKLLI